MQDHEDSIGQAENADALRCAYADALAAVGVAPAGGVAMLRRLYRERLVELGGAVAGVHAVARDDHALSEWCGRWLDPAHADADLRRDFADLEPELAERDKPRFTMLLAARDEWQAATGDDRVDDAVLQAFAAHLTQAPYGGKSDLAAASLRRIHTQYPAVHAVDPGWFESAEKQVRAARWSAVKRLGRGLYHAGFGLSVFLWAWAAVIIVVRIIESMWDGRW